MFSNLAQGNVLYGLDTKGEFKMFAAPIVKASAPYPGYVRTNGTQVPAMVVDIAANINGETQEFKQVPSNISIADFGIIGYILADNKDSLKVYVDSMVSNKRKAIDNIEQEKHLYEQYTKIADELNGTAEANKDNNEIKALRAEIASLKDDLKELVALRKSENNQN